MRCPTSHGSFRCAREVGHAGECETDATLGIQGRIVTLDHDAQRELAKAANRIAALEGALRLVRTFACASTEKRAACDCCARFRVFANEVLGGSQ